MPGAFRMTGVVTVFAWMAVSVPLRAGDPPATRPREAAFFGLHFDLHPGANDTMLGADVSAENIGRLLDRVRPDYVQYDCKGHPGYAGYPTKVGYPSPGIVKDALTVWRQETRARGIGLYVHFSGVWDSAAIAHHPDWAVVNADGKPDPNATSVFGPYVDELMIPQLIEVVRTYGLDGVWVDGECWAARLDWSPAALAAWRRETGREEAPRSRDDPDWPAWKQFHRRAFEDYLCRWVDAVHQACPGVRLTSNWMYTVMAPVPVRARLDFLSGDYSSVLSVDRARLDARYMASTGMPWDLMAWGFVHLAGDPDHNLKTPVQLQQEAAVVLMQGGGFQVYHQPTRSGWLHEAIIDQLGQVADFCRRRERFCHKSMTVPQVALLLSAASQLDRSDAVFTWYGTTAEVEGALHALLELHYSVDVLAEHQLAGRLKDYPVLVVADAHRLEEPFVAEVREYVRNGGALVLLGQKCARLFADDLGVTFEGPPARSGAVLAAGGGIVNVPGDWQAVTPTTARVLAERRPDRGPRSPALPAATIHACGRGRVAAVYGPVAGYFAGGHHPWLRAFIGQVMNEAFPEPMASLDGPPTVDLALRRAADGRLCVHLLNRNNAPQSRETHTVIDHVDPVGPMTLRLRLPDRPATVTWMPEGDGLEWTWADGVAVIAVPRLDIQGAVVIE